MTNRLCAAACRTGTAALLLATAVGCSSGPEEQPLPPGELAPGTAAITVNGKDLGEVTSVGCVPAGPLMTITTGDETSGSTAVISNADGLVAESVYLRDLGGFTGSYNLDLGGDADVELTGNTYSISGSADGFETAHPSFRTEGTFELKVAC
jgi:ipoprotein LpqH